MFSLLIPVFNEEDIIEKTINDSLAALRDIGDYEIVVINDGSTDRTEEMLKKISLPDEGDITRVRIVTHPVNRGYGASMKTGIRHSKGDIIGTVDADGTYPINDFSKLLKLLTVNNADMVVGARTKVGVQIPAIRRPAKWIIGILANTLTGMRIPDLNSGMRVFTRELAERFMHLYPQKFSFTITITLAALTNDYIVIYHPIDYFRRVGKSTLSSGLNGVKNFLGFLGLIVRIVTSFRPLKFFAWPAAILTFGGLLIILKTLLESANISDAGLLLVISGVQVGFFGILAEIVVRNRNR